MSNESLFVYHLWHYTVTVTVTVSLCLSAFIESLGCDQDYTSFSGTVSSPSFSSRSTYENSLDCTYDIKGGSGYGIKLSWSTFDVRGEMPDCSEDSVEIFIGCVFNRHSIGKYCSENGYKPFDVYSSDNCLRLVFKTNASGGGKGFQASYSSFRLSGNVPQLIINSWKKICVRKDKVLDNWSCGNGWLLSDNHGKPGKSYNETKYYFPSLMISGILVGYCKVMETTECERNTFEKLLIKNYHHNFFFFYTLEPASWRYSSWKTYKE